MSWWSWAPPSELCQCAGAGGVAGMARVYDILNVVAIAVLQSQRVRRMKRGGDRRTISTHSRKGLFLYDSWSFFNLLFPWFRWSCASIST